MMIIIIIYNIQSATIVRVSQNTAILNTVTEMRILYAIHLIPPVKT